MSPRLFFSHSYYLGMDAFHASSRYNFQVEVYIPLYLHLLRKGLGYTFSSKAKFTSQEDSWVNENVIAFCSHSLQSLSKFYHPQWDKVWNWHQMVVWKLSSLPPMLTAGFFFKHTFTNRELAWSWDSGFLAENWRLDLTVSNFWISRFSVPAK